MCSPTAALAQLCSNNHIEGTLAHLPAFLSQACPPRSPEEEGEEDEEPAAAPRVKECRLAGHLQPRGGLT